MIIELIKQIEIRNPKYGFLKSYVYSDFNRLNTAMLMTFGQFIDHDLTHVPMKSDNGNPIDCCHNVQNPFDPNFDTTREAVCFPIQIPRNDANFKGKSNCMNFARSESAVDIDCQPGPLQVLNSKN